MNSFTKEQHDQFEVEIHENEYQIHYRYNVEGFWTDNLNVMHRKESCIQAKEAPDLSWSSGGVQKNADKPEAARNFAAALLHAADLCEKLNKGDG